MIAPEDYAAAWQQDLDAADAQRARNLQTDQRVPGVSDIFHCRSYLARFLNGDPFTDEPKTGAARRGTWTHEGALPAIQSQRPGALVEQTLTVTLANGFQLEGHADLIEPDEPSVTDVKTVDGGLAAVRRNGANAQQTFQRHAYYAGAHQAGLVPPEGIVRNLWVDVADLAALPFVEQEPYNPAYLTDGARWIDEVMEHVENDTIDEASKDKDFFFCRDLCLFFRACRGEAAVPEEEVVSDELSIAAALDLEGKDLEREAKELRRAAAASFERLQGQRVVIVGSGGRFTYKSTFVKGGPVAYERKPSFRNEVKELP